MVTENEITELQQQTVMAALEDAKGIDPIELNVKEITDITDCMVIVSGTSDRHVKALADSVLNAMRKQGVKPLGIEGKEEAQWALIDYGDIIVHIMQKTTREFYKLEELWGEQSRQMYLKHRQSSTQS